MAKPQGKVTHLQLREKKERGEKIAMLTAYDASFARLCDQAGADVLLVGDSLGMVIQGMDNTLSVTMDQMVYHCQAVARGVRAAQGRAMVVGDMPFLSYQASVDEAIRNAGRLLKEGMAEAVKLEGGAEYAELSARLSRLGIPVMGHVGLTPQSVHTLGGFKVQGRKDKDAQRLIEDALSLEQAGCFAVVLEAIPRELAGEITGKLRIPTIGIGAGLECDGQVLVLYDLLGMNEEFRPRFVKRYENLALRVRTAVDGFISEVRSGAFPQPEHTFSREAPAARGDGATPYGAPGGPRMGREVGGREEPGAEDLGGADLGGAGVGCVPIPLFGHKQG